MLKTNQSSYFFLKVSNCWAIKVTNTPFGSQILNSSKKVLEYCIVSIVTQRTIGFYDNTYNKGLKQLFTGAAMIHRLQR